MNIAVCVKPVPDAAEIRINERNQLVREGLPLKINPADESAVEAALRLKGDGEICLVTMGSAAMGNVLKGILAHGADRAVLVSDPAMAGSDTLVTAQTLAAAFRYLGGFDLVLCGRRAIDGETGQTPPELAFFLGFPFVTNVTRVETDGEGSLSEGGLICERLLETGVESLRLPLPALVSLCEYSYPLRAVSLVSLKKVRGKELIVLDRKLLGLGAEECGATVSPTRVRRITANETPHRSGERETDLRAGAKKLAGMFAAAGRTPGWKREAK